MELHNRYLKRNFWFLLSTFFSLWQYPIIPAVSLRYGTWVKSPIILFLFFYKAKAECHYFWTTRREYRREHILYLIVSYRHNLDKMGPIIYRVCKSLLKRMKGWNLSHLMTDMTVAKTIHSVRHFFILKTVDKNDFFSFHSLKKGL